MITTNFLPLRAHKSRRVACRTVDDGETWIPNYDRHEPQVPGTNQPEIWIPDNAPPEICPGGKWIAEARERAETEDLRSRLRQLFLRYDQGNWMEKNDLGVWCASDRAPVEDDWIRLAISMAFRHKELGFEVYLKDFEVKSPKEDSQIERDNLMLDALARNRDPSSGKGNVRRAAELVCKELTLIEKRRKADHIAAGKAEIDYVPEHIDSESIRTDFYKRRRIAEANGLKFEPAIPSMLRVSLAGASIFNRLVKAAKNLSSQPTLRHRRK